MNKGFKSYLICWAIVLVIFNAVAFVSASVISPDGFTSSFWIGYAFISISFIGQLACANFTLFLQRAVFQKLLSITDFSKRKCQASE